MSRADVDRIREDLATMKKVAGVELPFGREDIWLSVALSIGGIIAVIWTLLPHDLPHHWGFVPFLILVVVYVVRLRIKYRRSTGRSPVRRREYTAGLLLAVIVFPLAVISRLWFVRLGIPLLYLQGIGFFVVGLALIFLAVLDRSRIAMLGMALPAMLCGLAIPFLEVPAATLVGGAIALGCLFTAAIQSWQLRAQQEGEDRGVN